MRRGGARRGPRGLSPESARGGGPEVGGRRRAPSSAPLLPAAGAHPLRSEEPPGRRTETVVPFLWEEAQGRPRSPSSLTSRARHLPADPQPASDHLSRPQPLLPESPGLGPSSLLQGPGRRERVLGPADLGAEASTHLAQFHRPSGLFRVKTHASPSWIGHPGNTIHLFHLASPPTP